MKKTKDNKKKTNNKVKEQKSLSIANHGDTVVIKNRSTLAAIISEAIILVLCIAGAVAMRDAWGLPLFWVVFLTLVAGILYSFASMIFGKIVLDSPNLQMTVYNPFKKQYKFEDINYVDIKSSKEKGGVIIHRVIVYIGEGKKSVEMTTLSQKQADELVSLLRGMLDNGAMTYPEGDEEPFNFDDDDEKKHGVNLFGLKKKKAEKKDENEPVKRESNKPDGKPDKKLKLPVFADEKTNEPAHEERSDMATESEKKDEAASAVTSEE